MGVPHVRGPVQKRGSSVFSSIGDGRVPPLPRTRPVRKKRRKAVGEHPLNRSASGKAPGLFSWPASGAYHREGEEGKKASAPSRRPQ